MKHQKTESDREKEMKAQYKEASDSSPVTASRELAEKVGKMVDMIREMDSLSYQVSVIRGEVMELMKEHSVLQDEDGTRLVLWAPGKTNRKVDYTKIFEKYEVSQEDIDANTVVTVSRTFTVLD